MSKCRKPSNLMKMHRNTVPKTFSMRLSTFWIITFLSCIIWRANLSTMVRQYRISKTLSQRWNSILKQSLLDLVKSRGRETLPTPQGKCLCMGIARCCYIRRISMRLLDKQNNLWPYSTKGRARVWFIGSCLIWRIWRKSFLCVLSRRKYKSSPSTRTMW